MVKKATTYDYQSMLGHIAVSGPGTIISSLWCSKIKVGDDRYYCLYVGTHGKFPSQAEDYPEFQFAVYYNRLKLEEDARKVYTVEEFKAQFPDHGEQILLDITRLLL